MAPEAASRVSVSVVFPDPAGPTSTTFLIRSGLLAPRSCPDALRLLLSAMAEPPAAPAERSPLTPRSERTPLREADTRVCRARIPRISLRSPCLGLWAVSACSRRCTTSWRRGGPSRSTVPPASARAPCSTPSRSGAASSPTRWCCGPTARSPEHGLPYAALQDLVDQLPVELGGALPGLAAPVDDDRLRTVLCSTFRSLLDQASRDPAGADPARRRAVARPAVGLRHRLRAAPARRTGSGWSPRSGRHATRSPTATSTSPTCTTSRCRRSTPRR